MLIVFNGLISHDDEEDRSERVNQNASAPVRSLARSREFKVDD